jgi:hypothetical protein
VTLANTAKISSSRCTHSWTGCTVRVVGRRYGHVSTYERGWHECMLAPRHDGDCLCDCGATTTKGDDRG